MNNYSECYKKNFIVKSFTFQHLFCIFIWYLIFALPFYFSFGGQKFWQKPKNELLSVNYNFTGYYAIQVNSFSTIATASLKQQYSNIIDSSMSNLSISKWSVIEKEDQSQISFTLNNFNNKQIIDLNLILFYNIQIKDLQKQISTAYVQHISGDNSYTQLATILKYQPQSNLNRQKYILFSINNKKVLNYPAYLSNLHAPSSFDVLVDYAIQNDQVHRLNQQTLKMSTIGKGSASRIYKIKLLKDNTINIPYYPAIFQTLKFSFSRWLAFVIIAYFIFYSLMSKLVKDGSLVTKQKDQIVNCI